jgi:uncharacterized membrane protein YqjE
MAHAEDITPKPTPRPQLPALGVALSLFSESVSHRAELAALEMGEAREHAVGSLLLTGVFSALTLFAGFAVTLLVASLVWDSPNRGWWLAGLSTLYIVGAVLTGVALSRRLSVWHPLEETCRQLQRDHQCLTNLIKSAVQ